MRIKIFILLGLFGIKKHAEMWIKNDLMFVFACFFNLKSSFEHLVPSQFPCNKTECQLRSSLRETNVPDL